MDKHYVIYREEYDRYGGGQESPNMISEKIKGNSELECLVKVLGILKGMEDEADEAIGAGKKRYARFYS